MVYFNTKGKEPRITKNMFEELFTQLEVKNVTRVKKGYLLFARLPHMFAEYKFLIEKESVKGYSHSGDEWLELTSAIQSLIKAKCKEYCLSKII